MTRLGKQQYLEHTYIRRRGRMTRAQARAFEKLASDYSCMTEEIQGYAGTQALGIEIGFGMGHALLEWAIARPAWRLCGIELYQPGIGALTDGLHRAQIDNVVILEQPAQQVMAALDDELVTEIRIFFPDPWPKKRHHKRRLIQPEFVLELARVLTKGGILRLATDWEPYAIWMRECLLQVPAFEVDLDCIRAPGAEMSAASARQTTNFERRGERLGHNIHDLVYVKHTGH